MKSQRLTITLGNDQLRQIATLAKRRRTSAAAVIRWALDAYIAENKVKTGASPQESARSRHR